MSFSPDSKIFASTSVDKTVKLWNRDSTLITTLSDHTAEVSWLNFSPDSKIFTSASSKEIAIRRLEGLSNLNNLLVRSCQRVRDYLKTTPKIEESDRTLCDGIGEK